MIKQKELISCDVVNNPVQSWTNAGIFQTNDG